MGGGWIVHQLAQKPMSSVSKQELYAKVEQIIVEELGAMSIECPEGSYRVNPAKALAGCFAYRGSREDFIRRFDVQAQTFATRVVGWETDYNVTFATFFLEDSGSLRFGVTYVPIEGNPDLQGNMILEGFRALVDLVVETRLPQ
ncbi:MAG: hypothetical protein C4332_15115 [Meiothermus sp.]